MIVRIITSNMDTRESQYDGGLSRKSSELTYAIFGSLAGLSHKKIIEMFKSHGYRINARGSHSATIVWSSLQPNNKFDRRSFHTRCRVKNLLDVASHEIISNKEYLHLAIAREDPNIYAQHFARTWRLRDFKFMPEHAYIIRPAVTGYCSGKGIYRISKPEELQSIATKFEHLGIADHVIVSEYLSDPYLYNGLKFHLRMYFMVRVVRGQPAFYGLFGADAESHAHPEEQCPPRAKILTAALPYANADYDNDQIHDTHAKSTNGALFFPTHATNIISSSGKSLDIPCVMMQMCAICNSLAHLLDKQNGGVRPYPESDNGFEVFGLDVMICSRKINEKIIDPCVVLLEVNDRVGYETPPSLLFDEMQDGYLQWVWTNGIEPGL